MRIDGQAKVYVESVHEHVDIRRKQVWHGLNVTPRSANTAKSLPTGYVPIEPCNCYAMYTVSRNDHATLNSQYFSRNPSDSAI